MPISKSTNYYSGNNDKDNDNDNCMEISSAQMFLNVSSQFLGGSVINLGQILDTGEYLAVDCCENCGVIVDSFCEVFRQLKTLQLQLEWKLESVVDIMNLANRVPSRLARVRKALLERAVGGQDPEGLEEEMGRKLADEKLKGIKRIRQQLINKSKI